MTDWNESDHPRAPDGKFGEAGDAKVAQRIERARQAVERTGGRVAAAEAKLASAKEGKRAVTAATRSALKEARQHAMRARKDPTDVNLRNVINATKAAAKMQAAVQTHVETIARHTATVAEAKTQHAIAGELHREAMRAAQPRATAPKPIELHPQGIGFTRVIGEHESGAQALTPSPEHGFAIGETRIRGVTEQPATEEVHEHAPRPAKEQETLLERIVRQTPKYEPPAPRPAKEQESTAARSAREQRARARTPKQRNLWEVPGVAAVSLPFKLTDVPGVSAVSLPRQDSDRDAALHPRGEDGESGASKKVCKAE